MGSTLHLRRFLKKFIDRGYLTIVLTGSTDICEEFPNCYWVTSINHNEKRVVGPTNLARMAQLISNFLRDNDGTNKVVAIDCLERIVMYNDENSVLKFLITVRDMVAVTGSTLLVNADPSAFSERFYSIVRREMAL